MDNLYPPLPDKSGSTQNTPQVDAGISDKMRYGTNRPAYNAPDESNTTERYNHTIISMRPEKVGHDPFLPYQDDRVYLFAYRMQQVQEGL